MEIVGIVAIVASVLGIVGIGLCILGTWKLTGVSEEFFKNLVSVVTEDPNAGKEFLSQPPKDASQPRREKVQALCEADEDLGPRTRHALRLLIIGLALQAAPYLNDLWSATRSSG